MISSADRHERLPLRLQHPGMSPESSAFASAMKSGTAQKVRDLRPPVAAQQRRSTAEKRRQDRLKPAAEPGEHGSDRRPPQQSRPGLPELHPGLWREVPAGE